MGPQLCIHHAQEKFLSRSIHPPHSVSSPMTQTSNWIPLPQPQQKSATKTPTQGVCAVGCKCPLLTLYPLAELVQALQRTALAQLGRCLRGLLHGSHSERLLQSHHDLVNLNRRTECRRKVTQETLHSQLFSGLFFTDGQNTVEITARVVVRGLRMTTYRFSTLNTGEEQGKLLVLSTKPAPLVQVHSDSFFNFSLPCSFLVPGLMTWFKRVTNLP